MYSWANRSHISCQPLSAGTFDPRGVGATPTPVAAPIKKSAPSERLGFTWTYRATIPSGAGAYLSSDQRPTEGLPISILRRRFQGPPPTLDATTRVDFGHLSDQTHPDPTNLAGPRYSFEGSPNPQTNADDSEPIRIDRPMPDALERAQPEGRISRRGELLLKCFPLGLPDWKFRSHC